MHTPRRCVFLDRDGVLIEDAHYLASPDRVRLIPGSAEAVAALNRAGWAVVVVTNQSGVARGLFGEADVHAVHAHLADLLEAHGATWDAVYFCPHLDGCDCRKPLPGMLRRAAADHGLDLARSWMVGDRPTDLEAGAAAGCRTVFVRTGYGATVDATTLDAVKLRMAGVVDDLANAVSVLIVPSERGA